MAEGAEEVGDNCVPVVGGPAVPEDVDGDVASEDGAPVVSQHQGLLGDQPQETGDREAGR